MRFGLGLGLGSLLVAVLSLGACSSGTTKGSCSGGLAAAPAAPAPAAPAAPPAETPKASSLDGSGPLSGDGEKLGTQPAYTGGGGRSGGGGGGGGGCDDSFGAPSADSASAARDPAPSAGAAASPSGPSTGTPPASGAGGNGSVASGVLTAGVWDDNKNFDRFLSYRAQVTKTQPAGLLPFDEQEHRTAHDSFGQVSAKQKLDVSLVIDTTGSMGDEIAYLQKEFDALAATIQSKFPGAEQRWSLVLYKDTQDEYVVRWFDFRSDTGEFRTKLAAQSAGGGGDFPEAPDQALDAATRLSWRSDANVAKLMFWVADAPHHAGTEAKLAGALRGAQKQGIHVYPVASSGIDEFTELTMRSSAQLTGGRYVFLTDDSGVGGEHKEASVPCYFVTKLDKAILRMVDIEMTGKYAEPVAADVIRTGGDPKSGACTLENGDKVSIY